MFFFNSLTVNFNCKFISIHCKTQIILTVFHIPTYWDFSLFILTLSIKVCLWSPLHPDLNLDLTAFFSFTQVNSFENSNSLTTMLHYHHIILDMPTS